MKPKEKRENRIRSLHQKALHGQFTKDGVFSFNQLVDEAEKLGIAKGTATSYANSVIERLQKGGHFNV